MNREEHHERRLEKEGSKLVYRGEIFSVRKETFQYEDGSRATREVVIHPGAVCIIPHDGRSVYMVEQPREAVQDPALLELPAGKLDVEEETPLECAQRELGEEIGMSAGDWRELKAFYRHPFSSKSAWQHTKIIGKRCFPYELTGETARAPEPKKKKKFLIF